MAASHKAQTDLLGRLATARCNICGTTGAISGPDPAAEPAEVATYNWREGLPCGACSSISRDRAVMWTLGRLLQQRSPVEEWPAWPDRRLFETSGYRGHPPRLAQRFDYFNTKFLPPDDLPESLDGREMANLEDLPYPSEFFDVVLSAEVLEHVSRIEPAISEIYRVLDPDGFAVITAPYVHGWRRTSHRVHRWHDRDVFLYPPEYHCEDTLVYRVYGRDLLAQLCAAGFAVLYARVADADAGVVAMDVIVASKGPFVDITSFLPQS